MIRSMTGFGSAEGVVGGDRVTVEIRSVNHRFFNPSIKLPSALTRWEGEVRDALRRAVSRGHVTVSARVDRAGATSGAKIDEGRFGAYVDQLRALQQRFGLGGDIDVATVLRLPDVMGTPQEQDLGTPGELVTIVDRAAASLTASREAEGARLRRFLLERLACIEESVGRLAQRAPERLLEHRDRLRASLTELTEGVQLDDQRMLVEIGLLAERWDVGEELDRFSAHFAAFRETLNQGAPEGVGKRLGFLLQEMLREANTTGSKANDAAMTREVLAIKEELERIREQVENLE